MASARSNESDYDFAEELAADIEIPLNEDNLLNNLTIQRMDQNLLMVLNGFRLDQAVFERFANSGIKYSQLANVCRRDLEMMGVTDVALQDEMLVEFANLEGQEPKLMNFFEAEQNEVESRQLETPQRRDDITTMDLIQSQLININMLLAATIMKVENTKTSNSPGVVVNQNFNSPAFVLHLLNRMNGHASRMIELIQQLKDGMPDEEEKQVEDSSYKVKVAVKGLLIASGMFLGFLLIKQLRFGRKLL